MSLSGCTGFKSQVFRPEKCQVCFLPKAVHKSLAVEKKAPPPVLPRPNRGSISQIAASYEARSTSASASSPKRSQPAPRPAPASSVSSEGYPHTPASAYQSDVFHIPPAGPIPPPAAPAPEPASHPAPAAAEAPAPPRTGLLTHVPVQTVRSNGPSAAALAACAAIAEDELDLSDMQAAVAQAAPAPRIHAMNTMALNDHFKRRESGFDSTQTGTLFAVQPQDVGEITGEPIANYEDDYTLGNMLGEGGYGQVFEAVPKRGLNRTPVAIKILPKNKLADQQSRDELRGEISIMFLVQGHSDNNFLKIIKVYETRTKIAIVSEMCKPETLMNLLERCGGERDAAHLFHDVVASIAALHSMGIIHRDIKPENFLIGMDNKLRCSDFGLAVPAMDLGLRGSFKEPGQAKGTLFFVPPEAFRNEFSFASDVWACGVLLYNLLCGVFPFKTVDQICSPTPLNVVSLRSIGISDSAIELVQMMLNKDPTKRPLTAEILQHPWLRQYCGTGSVVTQDVILKRLFTYGKLDRVKRGLMKVVGMTLQPSEIANVGQWFTQMDKDGSQSLTIDELKEAFSKRGVPEDKIDEVMKLVDINGDERLDYDEFITAAMSHSLLQREETLRVAFRRLDINGDGKLSRQELLDGFKGTGSTGFTPEEIDAFLQRYDKDHSGAIDYDEFVDMMALA